MLQKISVLNIYAVLLKKHDWFQHW